jgi:hypothetical protein
MLVTATGCGGCEGPLDDAAARIAEAVCPKAWECCTAEQMAENSFAGTDVESCKELTEEGFSDHVARIEESIDEGRSAYDPARLDACIETIRTSSCAALNRTNHFTGVPNCDSFVDPLVQAGRACRHDWECIDGFCRQSQGEIGTCRALPGEEEPCIDGRCAADLICHGDRQVCVRLAQPGEACSVATDCITFDCTLTSSTSGTCAEGRSGEQCFYASACSTFGSAPSDVFALALIFAGLLIAKTRLKPSSVPRADRRAR